MRTILEVADNSGAKKVSCIKVIHRAGGLMAVVGDIITANVKEVIPEGPIKKGELVRGVIVRTRSPILRDDGSMIRFNSNAIVLIDQQKNPRGTRILGPIARELRDRDFTKILSLAPEVL
jgi:large subunit ribosomal protein L14